MISGDAVLYTPGTGHTGQDTFRYRMQYTDDDRRTTYPARITVTVSASIDNNSPPVLEHIPNQDATRSETLTFSVTATDPNAGDDIQYMLFNQPDGATITQDGVFSWTPTDDHSDTTYEVIVVAADDKLMVGKQEVTITVSDP